MSVHKPTPHDSAALHVTGRARYTDDLALPGDAVHLCFGLSEVAAGRLEGLDLDAVRAAPGVIDVLTAADLPFANDVSPAPAPEPLLATDAVHFIGQPLFLVVADSHLAARRAARLGRARIAEEPPVLTIEDALAAGRTLEPPLTFQKGTPEAALAAAPRTVEGSIRIGGQEHFYLEGQAALAQPGEAGDVTVHCSTQHPSEIQHKVAAALDVPYALVRVETRRMGGGFGGKESQGNALAVACAVVAARLGRAARMRYDRDDDFTITGKRHDFRIDYRAGFDTSGRILGLDVEQYCRCGWSQDLSLPVADRAMLHADNAYHIADVRIRSHRLVTNTQSATAFRGFGGPQGMVGMERIIDHIAHALALDPAEVRRINYYADARGDTAQPAPVADDRALVAEGDVVSRGQAGGVAEAPPPAPKAAPDAQLTPYHMPVEDGIIEALTDRLARDADYAARRAEIRAWNADSPVLKRGIALTPVKFGISFTLTHLNQAGALVHLYADGSIHLNHGGTEMGQGLNVKVAQVAAEVFARPLETVRITATDTGKVPNTSATAASSGSDLNGMACRAACETIRARLGDFARQHWQATHVAFTPAGVEVDDRLIAFEELVKTAYLHRVSLSATGFYATPGLSWDRRAGRGRPFYYFAYGAAVTEVALDTLTGENRILRTDILHDCGASLNPAIDIGQIEGGFVQGAGWLTMEELVWDDTGRLRTHAPSTYKIPAASDRPREMNVALWDQPNRSATVYRSKAVGEPPLMLGISAFLALSDAVAACGDGSRYAALDAPATPERLLRAVDAQRGREW